MLSIIAFAFCKTAIRILRQLARIYYWCDVRVWLKVWCNNSHLPVDHIVAGSFETAMRVSIIVMPLWTCIKLKQKLQTL